MKIGLVSYWFNRGQAVVSRHLRTLLDSQGHETYVLARLTRKSFFKPFFVDSDDVWGQDSITHGSAYNLTIDEYLNWIDQTGVEVVFFDQNLQLEEIEAIRNRGVKTIGRFVWESFGPENVEAAIDAFDCIYSLTRCEQERYKNLGIQSPYIPWGCHPELTSVEKIERNDELVQFFYPGGYLSKRKPTDEVIEAFSMLEDPNARLIIKAQHGIRGEEFKQKCAAIDSRIQVIVGDLPTKDYYNLFATSDVSVAPSRWEGLGLHLYEAVAFGIPTITNNAPPMNEMVKHEETGLLIDSHVSGYRRPGVPKLDPDINSLSKAMYRMCDEGFRQSLQTPLANQLKSLDWNNTTQGYNDVLEQLLAGKELPQ